MTKILGGIGLVFFAIAIRKLLKTHHHPKDRRIILIVGVLLLLGCFSMIFSSGHMSEAEYVQEVVDIVNNSDDKIKQTDVYSDSDMKDTANFLGKEMKKLDSMKPPKNLPKAMKDSHTTLYDGIGKIKMGIEERDVDKIQTGQTIVSMTFIIYNDYIEKNPEKFY
ncbi:MULTISPECIES: hypothetical protein [unclassified Enterococcus]|uniref:hypothetical protein n=1 Tax=unclassified Enterococcus TaxID=2608891 RepID=UPI0015581B74|nr:MULTISPECIES: hypothetical protein [unclassified Enterococcus]MBS7577100.1 hypothetical protein [Enterococcus sp. MMGLQ5-2]MBS7584453.1 hypothetical protein [Enterococcus sp. MMGLQ5-1]NPD12308.1 hypothetical protein [Enterococcus sp. MMGLQ5-1]NPD36934.1 hypothetical protein [Enterococcus sp. MMGLQ5-2]